MSYTLDVAWKLIQNASILTRLQLNDRSSVRHLKADRNPANCLSPHETSGSANISICCTLQYTVRATTSAYWCPSKPSSATVERLQQIRRRLNIIGSPGNYGAKYSAEIRLATAWILRNKPANNARFNYCVYANKSLYFAAYDIWFYVPHLMSPHLSFNITPLFHRMLKILISVCLARERIKLTCSRFRSGKNRTLPARNINHQL